MLTNDIELAGTPYTVLPGAYKKGLRKPLAVSKPAARRTGVKVFGPFDRGVLQASDGDDERGWSSLTVGPVFDGEGVEPFPNSTSFADGAIDTPSTTVRPYGVVAGNRAYVGIGQHIFRSVALTVGAWAAWTQVADLGAGFVISGLAYWQDDLLVMSASGHDIRKFNTSSNAVTVWRTGEKARYGVAYAGQLIYAPCLANNQEELRLSGTKWNGNAVTHFRYLDAPIINMASFNGQVVIATRKSLYFMGGQPYPGEADDAAITGDSSRAPEWRGDPDPVMTHGTYAEGDDFVFLESYRGRLYTWLGGRVAEFDDSTEEANWRRIGPEGANCYGACVAGDWLIVAVMSRYGAYEAWGFNGEGWWLLFQRTTTPAVIWPMALAGAGDRDALLFRDGSTSYHLLRLRWRSTTLHTYATDGEWVSSLIDGGDPTADKAWTRMGATFAAPGDRGNAASVDSVSFPLEYSLDGGVTWTVAVSQNSATAAMRVFTREIELAVPPQSRVLQLRQRWTSVSDWAPVLTSLWVEYENAEEYALAELAQATYEAELEAEALLRRRWELTISASDRNVRRDGQLDARTGRQAIAALWDAWELGTTVSFKDIDNDSDPVTYVVAIAGIEEKAARPADGARWGESTVTLVLEESAPGVAAAPAGFNLDDLGDVILGVLVDGDVLTYDSATQRWVNEPGGGAHNHAGVYQPLDADLTDLAAIANTQGDIIIRGAAGWERLPKGTAGQVLTMNAGATAPEWAAAATGGSPIVDVGTLVIAGDAITLPAIAANVDRVLVNVDTEAAAATDNLDTINITGTLASGTMLVIRTLVGSRDVTLIDGANLNIAGNMLLDTVSDRIILERRGSVWFEWTRSNNA
jgi:hypothetical protein